MPELFTHSLAGGLIGIGLKPLLQRIDPLLIALGACIPDWISHLFVLFPSVIVFFAPLQEPIPLVLQCLLVASFFAPGERAPALTSLLIGAGSHYLLDFFQRHAHPVYRLLFPFSDTAWGVGLYSCEASICWAPFIAVFFCVALILRRRAVSAR